MMVKLAKILSTGDLAAIQRQSPVIYPVYMDLGKTAEHTVPSHSVRSACSSALHPSLTASVIGTRDDVGGCSLTLI
jgi:hypothetical protein